MGWLRDRMINRMRMCGLSTGTQESYLRFVTAMAKALKRSPAKLSGTDVEAWVLGLCPKYSPSTVGVATSALRFLFTVTLNRPEVMASIPRMRGQHTQPDVLSVEEIQRLLEHTKELHHRAIFMLMYGSGLRISEARHLRVGDIDSGRMVLHLRETKGRADRIVPLPAVTLSALREHWRASRPRGPFVFPGLNKSASSTLSRNGIHIALRKAALAAGIHKPVHPHLLRHSFATHMVEMGTDLRSVQILLGHRSLRSTERYTHLTAARRNDLPNPLQRITLRAPQQPAPA